MSDATISFRGLTGPSFRSDMAVDSIKLLGADTPSQASFASWSSEQSLSGENTDALASPEGDGIVNLLKYAFNMSVPSSGPRVLIPRTGTSGLPYFKFPTQDGERLTVEYLRNNSASDLSYQVVFSDDLSESADISSGVETSVTAIDSDWDWVIVEDDIGVNEADRRFGRVLVEIEE